MNPMGRPRFSSHSPSISIVRRRFFHGARSQKAATKKGVSVTISELAEAKIIQMIRNREGARHGSASGVGRANGSEQAEGERKASTARRPACILTSRRG